MLQVIIWQSEQFQRNQSNSECVYSFSVTNRNKYGVHGYDNIDSSMQAIFMANGPKIPKGKILESINMIDLYNLFCSILNIECGGTDGADDIDIWS